MDSDVIICRLCLEVVPIGYTLIKENVLNIIKALTSIDVSKNDNLPKLSCSKCIFNLYFVESMRKLVIKSDEKLRNLFLRDGNLNELLKHVNPPEQLPDEPQFANIEIKEEKLVPSVLDVPEVSEQYVNIDETIRSDSIREPKEESSKEYARVNCVDIINGDENNLNTIIYRKSNNKPYLYHCNVCNVDFRGNKLYMVHKGKHMKKTCEICGVTTRKDNFHKHMTNHSLGQQICDICGSIHKSLEGLRTHLFHFHNTKKKFYSCTECGAKFKYSHTLSYHKRKIHTGFRPHQCETCGKRFFDLGTLKQHVKLIHLKLREHHCKYCQKDYSSRHALKVHMRQHTNETPYVCEYCTEGFRQLVSLKTHLARYHKEKQSTSQMEQNESQEQGGIIVSEEILSQG